MQIIPDVIDEIKRWIYLSEKQNIDIAICEIGGTVGDIESLPFLEAIRQVGQERGKDKPFDLIFMDVQMPVMNGLDATRAIRKLDSDYAKNVPIIAMTADAFSENVAECIEAGMNAHIAKPIDLNLVLAEIKKVKSK